MNRGGIVSMRSSQYSEDVVRLVFVLDRELPYEVVTDPRGLRIHLDNPVGDFEPWSSGNPTPPAFDPTAMAPAVAAQEAAQAQEARRISVTWTEAPINDVLLAFAAFSGKSIVPGANVEGFVTADQLQAVGLDAGMGAVEGRTDVAELVGHGVVGGHVAGIPHVHGCSAMGVDALQERSHGGAVAVEADLSLIHI